MPSTRRAVLGSLCAGSLGLAGCTTLSDVLRSQPDRTVAPDWQPPPGTWPSLQYGPSNTRYNPHATPPRNTPETVWQDDVGNSINAVIVGSEQIYVATTESVLAYDESDGTNLWTKDVAETYRLHYIDGRVYELSSNTIRARTSTGELIWETSLSTWPHSLHEQDGYVFVGRQDGYSVLHTDTGEIVRTQDTWVETMAVNGDTLVGKGPHDIRGFSIQDRSLSEQWAVSLEGPYHSYRSPVFAGETLYQPERAISGSDAKRGRISRYTEDGTKTDDVSFTNVPIGLATADDTVFVGTSTITADNLGAEGGMFALASESEQRWEYTPDAGVVTPIVLDDVVIVGPHATSQSPLVAFDRDSGAKLWDRAISGTVRLAGAAERVYVGSETTLLALADRT